ncbi:MATE family efflux transporter [Vibrio sp. MEBiC08052]|uniref:MATE family efflux transporter n=1 Tax=Vibrio sp. MEBiC08052 TaxID=1761910 RepID=UPI0007406DC6|nr:MATE family efflux transporter [Vibrio sp. MEBiC08052]KUI98764.1 hypothetical protein VRK_20940 [Vibrio sp. MEBiC08052]
MSISKQSTLTLPASGMGDVKQVLGIAWPMILIAIVVSLSQNGQIWILGQNEQSQALYQLSMLQPFHFLFIALLECLTITNQVFSARSTCDWPSRKVMNSTLLLAVAGTVFLCLLAGVSYLFEAPLQSVMGGNTQNLFSQTLPLYLLSLIPLLIFELGNAGLRGQGKTLSSMLLISGFIIINLAVCYIGFVHHQLGFQAVIYANLLSASAMLPFSLFMLFRTVSHGSDPQPKAFLPRLFALMTDAGIPIFLSMLIAFASSAVIFPLISQMNTDYAPGFLIVVKLRSLFIIPAVALGSAIAIFVNQQLSAATKDALTRMLSRGMLAISLLYITLTAMVYLNQHTLVDLLANTSTVQQAGYLLLSLLLPTFFLTSMLAATQTMLEQLGRGKRVLLITLVVESAMVGGILILMRSQGNITELAHLIVIFNVVYFTIFLREYWLLTKNLRGEDAL